MAKLTIQEASQHFKVSKEAIHNRIRRGSLPSMSEHGVKYVIVDDVQIANKPVVNDDKYTSFLEEQNKTLQTKVQQLEKDNSSLRDQKEQMLIQERIKIENIYKEKDEQLKNILQSFSTKLLEARDESQIATAEIIDVTRDAISLKKYLRSLGLKPKKEEKIKMRFKMMAHKDARISIKEHKIFVNPTLYSYADILSQ